MKPKMCHEQLITQMLSTVEPIMLISGCMAALSLFSCTWALGTVWLTQRRQVVRWRSLPKISGHSSLRRLGPLAAGWRLCHLVRSEHGLLPVWRSAVYDGTGNLGLHGGHGQLDQHVQLHRPWQLRRTRRMDHHQESRSCCQPGQASWNSFLVYCLTYA